MSNIITYFTKKIRIHLIFYRVPTQPGKSGKVMEFNLETWKFINGIKHLESHGISLLKITHQI